MKRGFLIETFFSKGNRITSNAKASRWIKNIRIKTGRAKLFARIAGRLTLSVLEGLWCKIKTASRSRFLNEPQKTKKNATEVSVQAPIQTNRCDRYDLR